MNDVIHLYRQRKEKHHQHVCGNIGLTRRNKIIIQLQLKKYLALVSVHSIKRKVLSLLIDACSRLRLSHLTIRFCTPHHST